MEGVVAFYARDLEAAALSLQAARDRIEKLAVPDAYIVMLQEMGKSNGRVNRYGMHSTSHSTHSQTANSADITTGLM